MAQAIGDPEEIRNFSNILEHYLNTVEEETGRLNSAFEQLGESWQDQQRISFEETYKQLINALQNFKENASEQIPHLRIMAEDLSTYLGR
ncbi:MAG: WXG100 family type VII secretion target [Veillonellaceae bacterium]|nr:WXG100 family type VII secretion target [Veillonellaceae bacterium]